jgi:hypothetical protein
MSLWNATGLIEILGHDYVTTVEPLEQPWQATRRALRWNCDGRAIVATENPDRNAMTLHVSCHDPAHRELEEYCTFHLGDVVLLDDRKAPASTLRAGPSGYQLSLRIQGVPTLAQQVVLRLRVVPRDDPTRMTWHNVGTYAGGVALYTPALYHDTREELVLTLHAIPLDVARAHPDATGLVLWSGNVLVV